jgi:DNA-3-methyladenine glycosylase
MRNAPNALKTRPTINSHREQPDRAELRVLPGEFYSRDPRLVARELLGKVLVRDFGRVRRMGRIVEVEAYLGADDAAAHAAFGPTERNRVLFGPPGHAYVYMSYGLHYCLNVSCMPEGDAGCVLFRALEPFAGFYAMARGRGMKVSANELADIRVRKLLASGPARLCQALEITRPRDNGRDMTSPESGLWIANDGGKPESIVTAPRIGITKSAELPLRYYIAGNSFVSRK